METEISTAATLPYCGDAEAPDDNAPLNQHTKQRITPKPLLKLLSPKECIKVRTSRMSGQCLGSMLSAANVPSGPGEEDE